MHNICSIISPNTSNIDTFTDELPSNSANNRKKDGTFLPPAQLGGEFDAKPLSEAENSLCEIQICIVSYMKIINKKVV
jgi:hypothetical protein